MADSAQPAATGKGTHNAVLAGFLGWTFDAFDFFVLTFVLAPIAAEFGKTLPAMALTHAGWERFSLACSPIATGGAFR